MSGFANTNTGSTGSGNNYTNAISSLINAAGGYQSAKSAEDYNKITQANDKYNLDILRQQYNQDWANRGQSSQNWQDYVDQNFGLGDYSSYLNQAGENVSPTYTNMESSLNDLGNTLTAKGFYGTLPADNVLTKNAADKTASAKATTLGSLANQLYQTAKEQNLSANQTGAGQFGTYGDASTPYIDSLNPGKTGEKKSGGIGGFLDKLRVIK